MDRLTGRNEYGDAILCERLSGIGIGLNNDVERVAAYEDLGTVEELAEIKSKMDEGLLVELPPVAANDRKGLADYLHDCFAECIHDPSVGLQGLTEGEALLANAIIAALKERQGED